jgi:hypothetical protein
MLRKPGRVAPRAELLAEIVRAVRLAALGRQQRQMLARWGIEHRAQIGVYRDRERGPANPVPLHDAHSANACRPVAVIRTRATSISRLPGHHALSLCGREPGADHVGQHQF